LVISVAQGGSLGGEPVLPVLVAFLVPARGVIDSTLMESAPKRFARQVTLSFLDEISRSLCQALAAPARIS
jgi:hypothetical protein